MSDVIELDKIKHIINLFKIKKKKKNFFNKHQNKTFQSTIVYTYTFWEVQFE